MISVVVIDDEILVREGIKKLIPWEKLGFELVCEAANGRDALEIIKALKPDIVITDILIPLIDGIELIRIAKQLNLPSRFITLCTSSDNKYIEGAFNAGADAFIPKMDLKYANLIGALEKAKERLVDKAKAFELLEFKKIFANALPVLRNNFFKHLLFGIDNEGAEFNGNMRYLGINLLQTSLICAVININNISATQYTDNIFEMNSLVTNVIEEIIDGYKWSYVFNSEYMEFTIIYSPLDNEEDAEIIEDILKITDKIKLSLSYKLGITVLIGVSNIHNNYKDIRLAYEQALVSIRNNIAIKPGSIVLYKDIKYLKDPYRASNISYMDFEKELDALKKSLDLADSNKIKLSFDKIISNLSLCKNTSKENLKAICYIIVHNINCFLSSHDALTNTLWQNESELFKQINNLNVLYDFIQWMIEVKTKIVEFSQTLFNYKSIIIKARQYMVDNFDKNITLKILAKYLNISPNYLSYLYKKETGGNFIDYLTTLRVDYAKTLLKSTNYCIDEISTKVGFADIYYFSKVFKKITGYPPAQYRSNVSTSNKYSINS